MWHGGAQVGTLQCSDPNALNYVPGATGSGSACRYASPPPSLTPAATQALGITTSGTGLLPVLIVVFFVLAVAILGCVFVAKRRSATSPDKEKLKVGPRSHKAPDDSPPKADGVELYTAENAIVEKVPASLASPVVRSPKGAQKYAVMETPADTLAASI